MTEAEYDLPSEALPEAQISIQEVNDSMEKKFAIAKEQLQPLVEPMGYCLASDRIMVDGHAIGYMYRESPSEELDSGWCFFAGDESQEYTDEPSHFGVYEVNTVANYDGDIIPHLETPAPCAFEKEQGTNRYRRVEDPPGE